MFAFRVPREKTGALLPVNRDDSEEEEEEGEDGLILMENRHRLCVCGIRARVPTDDEMSFRARARDSDAE